VPGAIEEGSADGHRTRRSVLAAAVGAAGVFVAQALGRPQSVEAASVVLGANNNETTQTKFTNTAANGSAWALSGVTTYTGSATGSRGVVGISNGANGVGVAGQANTGSSARGVLGLTATGVGVQGQASGSGYGVRGTGGYNGVYGSGGSYGVIGSGGSGYGVYGSGNTGLYGSGSTYGAQAYGGSYGVYASGSSFGVYGQGATGVYGTSSAGSGVYGISSEVNSAAVYGTGGQYGVQGANARTAGVRGDSGYVGVWGEGAAWGFFSIATATTGQNYGIMSQTLSPAGYAGYFKGNVYVEGTLAKAAGAFRIDHPLDPDRRWLSHSFVESPDMMNVYNGVVSLDGGGRATVRLPDYFGALNRDFRYQLTPIGAAAPSLHVERKVERNEFRIAGGSPGQEISWQVTGIRQDDYANEHRIEVDTPKSKADQGTRMFVPKGSSAKQMVVGPLRPTGVQPVPATVKPAPDPRDVRPRAPAD
jgi:hypothetical protein